MGFSLEEVRELLDEGTHKPSVKQLEEKIKQVEQLLKNLQDRLILLRRMADSQAKIDTAGRIFVQRLPEIVVASHRQVLAKRSDLTALCAHVLGPEIQRIGCKRSLPIYSFVIEHDEEYKTTDVDTEYCEQVEEMMPDTRLIQFKRLPEIPMAVCMKCYGSYQHWYEQKAEAFRLYRETRLSNLWTASATVCGGRMEPERPGEVVDDHTGSCDKRRA